MLLFADASVEGWGAHLQDFVALVTCSQEGESLHINLLEMCAVLLALHIFSTSWYCGVDERQHLSSGLHQARRDNLLSVPPLQTVPDMGWVHHCDLSGTLHTGSMKCGSRPVEPSGSGHWHGVVSPSSSGLENLPIMGAPVRDFFASALNNKFPVYCSLRPELMAWQEDVPDSVGQLGHVCLSPIHSDQDDHQSCNDILMSQNDSDCPMLDTPRMVSQPANIGYAKRDSHVLSL